MNRSYLLTACVVAIAAAAPLSAQDMAVTAGSRAKVVLDNDKVRVLEVNLPPGSSTGMHSHGDNVVVYVSGGMVVQTMGDGSTKQLEAKPGEVRWSDPVTHDTKNIGKAATRAIVIELKEAKK
jgi:quercetin dioxygenase-like cupin family protein